MVYYLKYRPQTISDLDNARVRESLYSVLSNPDSIPHAFFFTGPKGLGKTSSARILAKAVNCTARTQGSEGKEPCNVCDQCVSITNGSNVDIQEIDAASNRGIDEMRDLKEKIRLSPVQARKKVYIIDEVHMLTTEAFNALLKTLEEPPSHAMFVLCTTEPHKVPNTIISRCFHVAFSKATTEELVRSFRRIATGEKLAIDDTVLTAVAKLSDGGFRDGAKMLEELVSLANNDKVTLQTLEKVYKTTSIDQAIVSLLSNLKVYDIQASLKLVTTLMNEGVDAKYFNEQLIQYLHSYLLHVVGLQEDDSFRSDGLILHIGELKQLLSLFMKAGLDMRFGGLAQLPIELAILEWCATKDVEADTPLRLDVAEAVSGKKGTVGHADEKEGLKREGKDLEKVILTTTATVQPTGATVNSMRRQVGNILRNKALHGEVKEEIEIKKVNKLSLEAYNNEGPLSTEWLQEFWRCMIEQMKTHNHTIAGVLRGCTIGSFDKTTLIIVTAYKFHLEKLVDNKIKLLIESTCKELVGKPITVSIVLKQ